jgi:PAS domain S-box-containing protein
LSEYGIDDEQIWAVVDAAPDAMLIVDEDGTIVLVNRQTEAMFGYERSDLLGGSVEDLLPEHLREVHRAHRARFGAEPRTRPMGAYMALSGRRRDGSQFPVEVSLSPLTTESGVRVVAAVRDISERVAAEAEARRVQAILDATRDGVFIFDRDSLRFSYVNQGALAQVGYARDELLQMTPLDIAPEFSEPQLRELLHPVATGEISSATFATVHRRRDGSQIPVEVVVQAPSGDGEPPRSFVAMARDITERVRSEERLREAAQTMRLLEDRERIARDLHDLVIQRLFAAGMALQATRGMTDDADVVKRIDDAVDQLDETIREIRTVIFELQSEQSRPPGLRRDLLDIVAEERSALGFEPRVRFDGPVDALSDELCEHLRATPREALSNVARHAAASSAEISLTVDERASLRVDDDGVGIPAEPSSGHGLANMRQRAERLGGWFRADPRPGGGTTLEWVVPNR